MNADLPDVTDSSGSRAVLIVDDEPFARAAIRRGLRDRFALVEEAANGADALARIVAGERFALILCDVSMPRMSGPAFYAALRSVAPEMLGRFAFISGGARDPSEDEEVASTGVPLLLKPFRRAELHELVERFTFLQ